MTLGHWIIIGIFVVGVLANIAGTWPRSRGPVDGPGEEEF